MKIKIKKKAQINEENVIENNDYCFEDYYEFENKCRHKATNYSNSQLETLSQFHNELDNLRSEIQRLTQIKQQLEKRIRKKANDIKPIDQKDLFAYCSNLNKVSKGKFGDKK